MSPADVPKVLGKLVSVASQLDGPTLVALTNFATGVLAGKDPIALAQREFAKRAAKQTYRL